MKALIFNGPGRIDIEERPEPMIQHDDDVKIQVLGVGICGSDLHMLMVPPKHPAKPGIIFGHEFCGQVVEVGSGVKTLKPGDKVVIDPHPPCGHCDNCRSDRPGQCTTLYCQQDTPWPEHGETRGIFRDGGLAKYAVVPAHSAFRIAQDTPTNLMCLAEPLSCVGYAIEKLDIQCGDTVCVLGAGPMGLLFTAMAKANGARKVIVSEPHALRREKALKCGATRVLDPTKESLVDICLEETDGLGVDHCIEAVGWCLQDAINVIRQSGKVIMFGHDETATPPIRLADIVRKEANIMGGFLGKYYFEKTAKIIESGLLPLEEIATNTFPMSRYWDGVELLNAGKAIKVMIVPEE